MTDLATIKAAEPLSVLQEDSVRRMLASAQEAAAGEASAYFLHSMLLAIETLANGNKMVAGRAFDDAMTHFLADLKAELGDEYATGAAILLIRNIALFLKPGDRDAVHALLRDR